MKLNHEAARQLVQDRGLNITHLAQFIGVDRAHLSNVLAGRRSGGPKIVKGIADYAGVSPMILVAPESPEDAVLRLCELYKITPKRLAEHLSGSAA